MKEFLKVLYLIVERELTQSESEYLEFKVAISSSQTTLYLRNDFFHCFPGGVLTLCCKDKHSSDLRHLYSWWLV